LPALTSTTENLMRHADSGRVEFSAVLKTNNIVWQSAADAKSTLDLTLAAASLDESGRYACAWWC
jgi:hypothetical protein